MQTDNYKKSAADVRKSARAQLIEIRRARLARKTNTTKVIVHSGHTPAEVQAERPAEPPLIFTHQTSEDESSGVDDAETPPNTIPSDPMNDIALRNTQGEHLIDGDIALNGPIRDEVPIVANESAEGIHAALSSTSGNDDEDIHTEPTQSEPESEIVAPQLLDATVGDADTPEADSWSQSPLAALPGAGPGLIWMLNQCEIITMEDLAERPAETLGQQMGLVGRILDVSQWVDFARATIAPRSSM